MLDLYFYTSEYLILLFLIGLVMFILQCIHVASLTFRSMQRSKVQILGETILLSYYGVFSFVPIHAIVNRTYGIVTSSDISVFMLLSGVLSFIYLIIVHIKHNRMHLISALAIALLFPIVEHLAFGWYLRFYIISLCIFLYRVVCLVYEDYMSQKNRLTPFSLKEGLNTLPMGIMFFDEDGYIYLINHQMEKIISQYFTQNQRNGNLFWKDLISANVSNSQVEQNRNHILLYSSDKTWAFSKKYLTKDAKIYYEVHAIDVTEEFQRKQQLENNQSVLLAQKEEIERIIEKDKELRRQQEYSRIRTQVHDVMSQRLSALQRILNSSEEKDYKQLTPLLNNIVTQIKDKENGNLIDVYEELCLYFNKAGLQIILIGELPKDNKVASLLLSVLREAAANATRHAGATKLSVEITQQEEVYRIEITNNGTRPKKGIVMGSGLSGIINRVENAGGIFRVEVMPQFALVITVKGE